MASGCECVRRKAEQGTDGSDIEEGEAFTSCLTQLVNNVIFTYC